MVVFLSYFVIATEFLFDQSMAVAAYEFGAMVVVTAAMVGMNQFHTRVRPVASLRLAAGLVAQALPLTVVLFVFFPRVAPLWTVPLPGGGTTGISEQMTPGDIANLTQSDQLAFRVVFDDEVPAYQELYWRGLVYSDFHNGTWSAQKSRFVASPGEPAAAGDAASYQVLMEPTMRDWLYALDRAVPETPGVRRVADYTLRSRDPVMSVFRYEVSSYPGARLDGRGMTRAMEVQATRYPVDDNPRIQAYADELWQRTGDIDGFVRSLLQQISSGDYHYTLKPPILPSENSIDAFWFDTQRGFCTHYAGALVFMLRSVGAPARMVGGYQGGEINPITGHLVVRQYDAHAWVEVWDEGRGWRRVDPTQAVAPARIESGIEAALSAEDRAELAAMTAARLGDWTLVSSLLNWSESLEHRWNLWVIGFDAGSQRGLLEDLLGDITPVRIGLAMLFFGALSLSVAALALFWRRRPTRRHPVERAFRSFGDAAARHGYEREVHESPMVFVERVGHQARVNPAQLQLLIAQLEALLYNPAVAWGSRELKYLRTQLRRLHFRLAFASTQ